MAVYRKIAASAAAATLVLALSFAMPGVAQAQTFRANTKIDIRIAPDRSVTQTVHQEMTPLVESAVRAAAQTRWTIAGNQTFEILEAFTRKADGTVVNADPKDFATQDGVVGIAASFSDVKIHQIPLRNLALGDTAVLTVRSVEKQHYIPGQYSLPLVATPSPGTRNLDITLRAPADLAIRHDERRLAYDETKEGDEIVRHWSGRVDPVTTSEQNVVDLPFAVPSLRFSTFPNFEAIATDYYDGAKPMLAVTPEIERLAAEITAGKTDVRTQAQALFDWVSRHIRYVSVVFGNGRYVPNDTHTILARRFGDCKDHAALLSALLAAKGIDSEQVLIETKAVFQLPQTPLLQAFNHVIVYLPALDRYLDPTLAFGSFEHLPISDLGKPVVRVSEHGATLARTPTPGIEDNSVSLDTRVTITPAGRQQGHTTIAARGEFADKLRAFLAQTEAKGKDVQMANLAKVRGVGGKLTLEAPPSTDAGEPVRVTTGWDMQPASNALQSGWPTPPGLSPMVAHPSLFFGNFESHKRVYLAGCRAGKIVHNIELTLPDGVTPGALPFPIVQRGPLFSFQESWSADSHHVRGNIEVTSSVTGRVCTPEQIEAVRGAYRAIAGRATPVLRLNRETPEATGQNEAIPPGSKDAKAYYNRGNTYLGQGDRERAIADYNEAIKLKPDLADAYTNRGKAYGDMRDCDRAIADFDEAIRLQPKQPRGYSNRGVAYLQKGDNDRAIADFDAAIRLDPNYARAYFNRGNAYIGKGDRDRAVADWNEAIRLDPKDANAYTNRGKAYLDAGDNDRAIADFNQAVRLDPKNVKAYGNRAVAYGVKGEYDRAIADFNELIGLNPNDANTYNNRGVAYYAKHDYDRAIADLSEAIRLDPKLAKAYRNRGNAYREKGDKDRATADYNEATKLDPESAASRQLSNRR